MTITNFQKWQLEQQCMDLRSNIAYLRRKNGRRAGRMKTSTDNCTGCRYKNQDPNEDPCYRCRNSSEYVPEDLSQIIPDAGECKHV